LCRRVDPQKQSANSPDQHMSASLLALNWECMF
jgi:hypothetical protein